MRLPLVTLANQRLDTEEREVFPLELSEPSFETLKTLSCGSLISVRDCMDNYYLCCVVAMRAGRCYVKRAQKPKDPSFSSMNLDLAIGIAEEKTFETIIRFSAELGVRRIIPFTSAHASKTQTSSKNKNRFWENFARKASLNCGRTEVLALSPVQSLSSLRSLLDCYDLVLFCWEEAEKDLSDEAVSFAYNHSGREILVIVGPKGGFNEDESKMICEDKSVSGKKPVMRAVSLGETILSPDTAVLTALVQLKDAFSYATKGRDDEF
ncbi:MAG: RsmE family RNA methyltransferase [Eggerthellaceae bacterium]|jgi:16S rRNA (uracil1498-N3)-methyltransferase